MPAAARGGRRPRTTGPRARTRPRLIEAHRVAQEFYAEQLATPDALAARQFLDRARLRPGRRRDVRRRLRPARRRGAAARTCARKGFTDEESVAAGLVAHRAARRYDRFRGRLLWPIRDATGDTIGFGARRIFDDDRIEAKYLNTPETPIYKKSQVLYGIDLARRDIARSSQAVVVEGYTDVMACHLSGVATAVATCGTAFGDEHARVLRRFLHDHEEFRGEVIFTFDGDAAGQKAALRAFGGDQNFVSQTYVAVEPDGLDPCDLRIQKGDAAVRELVARRVPLYRFVLSNVVGKYDLDRADGRVDALREAARLVSSIRDKSKVDAFARELAGMIGVDVDEARAEVRRAAGRPRPTTAASAPAERRAGRRPAPARGRRAARCPTCATRGSRSSGRRSSWCSSTRRPSAGSPPTSAPTTSPTRPTGRCGRSSPPRAGPAAGAGDAGWATKLRDAATDPAVSSAISALAVEPLLTAKEPDAAYVAAHVYRLQELTTMRRIADLKSRLQRTNPVEHADRLQPDVRRAGRARAAPPHAARARDGRASEAAGPRARVRRRAGGARARLGRRDGGGALARHAATRSYLPAPATRQSTPGETRGIPWEQVEAADWDRDSAVLRVTEVGSWGEQRPEHAFTLERAAAGCSQLVRERVTASVVLQRHVPVARSPRAAGDRPPGAARDRAGAPGSTSTTRASTPTTPTVRRAAAEALAAARDEVGPD